MGDATELLRGLLTLLDDGEGDYNWPWWDTNASMREAAPEIYAELRAWQIANPAPPSLEE